jgi:hypothetical protein
MAEPIILLTVIPCFTCIVDFLLNLILSFFQQNYSHLEDTMSELGTKEKPFSLLISIWWVFFGFAMIIFALGYALATDYTDPGIVAGTFLVSIFGICYGILAGLFPDDPKDQIKTPSGKIHSIATTVGFIALLLIPGIFAASFFGIRYIVDGLLGLFIVSVIVQIIGVVFFVLYFVSGKTKLRFSGLWQRLYLAVYYIYFITLSIHILVIS